MLAIRRGAFVFLKSETAKFHLFCLEMNLILPCTFPSLLFDILEFKLSFHYCSRVSAVTIICQLGNRNARGPPSVRKP